MIHRMRVFGIAGILLAISGATAMAVRAGNPVGPSTPPDATQSYTLEDIHDRLESGVQGAQSTFTEPAASPLVGTMHTLNEIMAKAPAADDVNGATAAEVLEGKTFWGLNAASGQWGLQTGALLRSTAGNPSPGCWDNENRYVDCGNGTVMDMVTNLLWLKNANCYSQMDHAAANAVVTDLASGACGLTDGSAAGDWRLPTKAEWEATIAQAKVLSCRPGLTNVPGTQCYSSGPQPFTGVEPEVYWSANAADDYSIGRYAWIASLYSGGVHTFPNVAIARVWPVRAR